MKIITISGLDGSGKSTQIEKLKNLLEKEGEKVFYFHAIQFSFAQKLKEFKSKYCLFCKLTGRCSTDINKENSVTKANKFQLFLRKIFLRLDILRFKSFIKKKQKTFDYILSDRYFYDSIVNVEYLSGKEWRNNLSKMIPLPDIAIYLDVEPALIMQRKRVPDQGIEYLRSKRDIYDKKVRKWKLTRIDGNKEKNEIFEEILSLIQRVF